MTNSPIKSDSIHSDLVHQSKIDTVILDIEGTICPITFVKDKLFPYFIKKLPEVLNKYNYPINSLGSNDPIINILENLPSNITNSSESIYDYLKNLVDNDIKDPVLKSLQGFIWDQGYKSGELKSPVYKDSIEFIEKFPSTTKKIYIYSSGSINAQKLLFGHVDVNGKSKNLNKYLSGYFDITTAGYKNEYTSYTKILKEIGKLNNPKTVLFLSDNINEVKAAIKAEMQSYIVIRPGNAPIPSEEKNGYRTITSLYEIDI
ncbi:UTR4 [Candida pseudojiufengensis]|uniref:UTR4 n=1 Tax=Candida pseudojiufengensis TaxID=497109 RepID=UPI0022244319|nr:UTR4 [Candida pseudojiufengensis]KAI5963319.1 UTR4 [Candida pseudojiufengensis]